MLHLPVQLRVCDISLLKLQDLLEAAWIPVIHQENRMLRLPVQLRVCNISLLKLQDLLETAWIPVIHQENRMLRLPVQLRVCDISLLKLQDLIEASRVPVIDQYHAGHPQQVVWEQVNLLHYVGQPDGQLLPQEHKRLALAGTQTCVEGTS